MALRCVLVTDSGISVKIRQNRAHHQQNTTTSVRNRVAIAKMHVHVHTLIQRDTYRRSRRCIGSILQNIPRHSPLPAFRTTDLFCIRTSVRILGYTNLVQIHLANTSPSFRPLRSSNPSLSDALLSTLVRSRIPPHSVRSLNSRLVIDVAGRLLLDEKPDESLSQKLPSYKTTL